MAYQCIGFVGKTGTGKAHWQVSPRSLSLSVAIPRGQAELKASRCPAPIHWIIQVINGWTMVVNHFLSGMILQGAKGISSFRLDGYMDICISYGMKTFSGNWDLEGVYIYIYIYIYIHTEQGIRRVRFLHSSLHILCFGICIDWQEKTNDKTQLSASFPWGVQN